MSARGCGKFLIYGWLCVGWVGFGSGWTCSSVWWAGLSSAEGPVPSSVERARCRRGSLPQEGATPPVGPPAVQSGTWQLHPNGEICGRNEGRYPRRFYSSEAVDCRFQGDCYCRKVGWCRGSVSSFRKIAFRKSPSVWGVCRIRSSFLGTALRLPGDYPPPGRALDAGVRYSVGILENEPSPLFAVEKAERGRQM